MKACIIIDLTTLKNMRDAAPTALACVAARTVIGLGDSRSWVRASTGSFRSDVSPPRPVGLPTVGTYAMVYSRPSGEKPGVTQGARLL